MTNRVLYWLLLLLPLTLIGVVLGFSLWQLPPLLPEPLQTPDYTAGLDRRICADRRDRYPLGASGWILFSPFECAGARRADYPTQ